MDNLYKSIVSPILDKDANGLRKAAFILEEYQSENDDNLFRDARLSGAEVLNRVARLQDFVEWVFSDEFEKDLEDAAN